VAKTEQMRTAQELKQDIIFKATLRGKEFVFHTTWGLFSPRSVDNGSYLLIKHLEIEAG
jgi:16S rRNA G1207 methylase RsmC